MVNYTKFEEEIWPTYFVGKMQDMKNPRQASTRHDKR